MPNPLSADIRARFEVLFAQGLTGREIGRRRLMISAASASRLSQKLKQGLGPTPAQNARNTGHGRLAPYHDFLIELNHQDPDITLKELQGALSATGLLMFVPTEWEAGIRCIGTRKGSEAVGSFLGRASSHFGRLII